MGITPDALTRSRADPEDDEASTSRRLISVTCLHRVASLRLRTPDPPNITMHLPSRPYLWRAYRCVSSNRKAQQLVNAHFAGKTLEKMEKKVCNRLADSVISLPSLKPGGERLALAIPLAGVRGKFPSDKSKRV